MNKVYISAGLFLALSALKLLLPEQSAEIRRQVLQLITQEQNCPEVVEALGRKLSRGELPEEFLEALGIRDARRLLANAREAVPDTVITFSDDGTGEQTP